MRSRYISLSLFALVVVLGSTAVHSAPLVSGDPAADGWVLAGHSLQNGVYATGSANYGFDAYSAGITIPSGSNLEISDGSMSWLAGDTVLGVGGKFASITAGAAGWGAITGNSVNQLLPTSSPYSGPKLQAKFGTSLATWTTSTTAPNSGNGNSSSGSGGGRVQIRTSGYFQTGTPLVGQTEPWTWDGNSGQVLVLDKPSHIVWGGDASIDKRFARMIWVWDNTAHKIAGWELLLNSSLMGRLYPGYSGPLPDIGDMAVLTVQNGDGGSFTDALVDVTAVPEPASVGLVVLAGMAFVARRRNRGVTSTCAQRGSVSN